MAEASRPGLEAPKLKNNRIILPKDPGLSVERQFEHLKDHTLLLVRFDFISENYSILIKSGKLTTFGQFMDGNIPLLFQRDNLSKDAAICQGLEFIEALSIPSE